MVRGDTTRESRPRTVSESSHNLGGADKNHPRRCAKLTGDIIRPADIDMSSAGINLIDILILTRKKSLVLWGPTRMGKTLLARCFGKHSYFGGLFNLDQYDKTAEYAVFDDLHGGMEFFHSYKQWLGGQKEFTSTDKYRKTKHQVRKILSILQQHRPQRRERCRDRDWLEGNCKFVYVDKPIFTRLHANTQSIE